MTDQDPMDPMSQLGPDATEEELRAAYEAQLASLRVEDVVLQTVVSLLNLGGRKAGLAPGTEDERDLEQVGLAIEGARRLLPLVETALGPDAAQLKEAISQLQLAWVKLGGQGGAPGADATSGTGTPGSPTPAGGAGQGVGGASSQTGPGGGRLWVPGQ